MITRRNVIRSISSAGNSAPPVVYLTFDDGPDETGTRKVLELLAKHNATATFFVVADQAKNQTTLITEMITQGHAIGNHSLDHRYGPYFRRKAYLKGWLEKAERELTKVAGTATVGFRPPAGVCTPHLVGAAHELELPIILWNERFYDAVFRWNTTTALKSAQRLRPGSIVLLHDRQKPQKLDLFLQTLGIYIEALAKRGFEFRALSRALCKGEYK